MSNRGTINHRETSPRAGFSSCCYWRSCGSKVCLVDHHCWLEHKDPCGPIFHPTQFTVPTERPYSTYPLYKSTYVKSRHLGCNMTVFTSKLNIFTFGILPTVLDFHALSNVRKVDLALPSLVSTSWSVQPVVLTALQNMWTPEVHQPGHLPCHDTNIHPSTHTRRPKCWEQNISITICLRAV